jgi:hypothetical protein
VAHVLLPVHVQPSEHDQPVVLWLHFSLSKGHRWYARTTSITNSKRKKCHLFYPHLNYQFMLEFLQNS